MKVEGVEDASVDLQAKTAWVRYDDTKTNPRELVDEINKNTPFKASIP